MRHLKHLRIKRRLPAMSEQPCSPFDPSNLQFLPCLGGAVHHVSNIRQRSAEPKRWKTCALESLKGETAHIHSPATLYMTLMLTNVTLGRENDNKMYSKLASDC
jgi:hypothetical protein